MRKVVALAVAIIFALTALWLVRLQDASRQDTVIIAVSATPLSAPVLIAQTTGLFEAEGLDVDILQCNGGNSCFQIMSEGKADLATSSTSVAMFRAFSPFDFRIFGSFATSGNDIKLVALKGQTLNNLSQLSSYRAGMVKGTASEYFFDSLMILAGEQQSPELKHFYQPDQLGNALLQGDVDIVSIWEPWGYKLLQHDKRAHQLDTKGLYQLSFNLMGPPLSSDRDIQKMVHLFSALEQANLFISQHPLQAKKILSEQLNLSAEQVDWSWSDYHFQVTIGNQMLSTLEDQAHWAINAGVAPHDSVPDFRNLIDSRPIERLRRSD